MHIDLGYPRSFYDITTLRHFQFYQEWQTRFTHTNDYFWIVIEGFGVQRWRYVHYAWDCIYKAPPGIDDLALKSYDKMHARYLLQVKWGTCGFKKKEIEKQQWLMKKFDCIKLMYNHLLFICRHWWLIFYISSEWTSHSRSAIALMSMHWEVGKDIIKFFFLLYL